MWFSVPLFARRTGVALTLHKWRVRLRRTGYHLSDGAGKDGLNPLSAGVCSDGHV